MLGVSMKRIAAASLVLSLIIAGWSKWVWLRCGYDCGLLSVNRGPASVMGWYLALIIAAIAMAVVIYCKLKENKQ